jgi:hypothetical protein
MIKSRYYFPLYPIFRDFGCISSGFCYHAAQKAYNFVKIFKLRPKDQFGLATHVLNLPKSYRLKCSKKARRKFYLELIRKKLQLLKVYNSSVFMVLGILRNRIHIAQVPTYLLYKFIA